MSLNLRTTRKIRYYESIIVVTVVMVVSNVEDDKKSFRMVHFVRTANKIREYVVTYACVTYKESRV